MPKRKREDDDDYVDFCSGLKANSRNGIGNRSFIYSNSRHFKRPKINPNFYAPATTVHYRYVDYYENIYHKIKSLITNESIVIDYLIEVKNDILEDAYYAKKKQKQREFKNKVDEYYLFHGTREQNVSSICKFNFDWRLTGVNRGHKFGKGVYFSSNAKYASSYSDQMVYQKVMIVARVLIANICRGNHDMSIPPPGYDTSQKGNEGIVFCKYEDNEFFPAFVMYYHFRDRYDNDPYWNRRDEYYNNQEWGRRERYGRRDGILYNGQKGSDCWDYTSDGLYHSSGNYYSFCADNN